MVMFGGGCEGFVWQNLMADLQAVVFVLLLCFLFWLSDFLAFFFSSLRFVGFCFFSGGGGWGSCAFFWLSHPTPFVDRKAPAGAAVSFATAFFTPLAQVLFVRVVRLWWWADGPTDKGWVGGWNDGWINGWMDL